MAKTVLPKPVRKGKEDPFVKGFDVSKHQKLISELKKVNKLKKFEEMCEPMVMEILKSEGFEVIKNANEEGPKYKWKFSNPPFDFLGYKKGEPYLIEFKGSLSSVHTPGETQKRRLQELRAKIDGLHVALLQIKLSSGKYRILLDGEMDKLFNGPKKPLDPVENWIREQLINHQ